MEDFVDLYRQAFKEYKTRALWNKRQLDEPNEEDALVVARALRIEGNLEARKLAEQIEQLAVPLSKPRADILSVLASHRSPESYVAGATPLNRNAPRLSEDINVFHDREERVTSAAADDARTLVAESYDVKWLRQSPAIYSAEVSRDGFSTRLEWVADTGLTAALDQAEAFVTRMPTNKIGLLFLQGGKAVEPDPGSPGKLRDSCGTKARALARERRNQYGNVSALQREARRLT